MTAGVSGAGVGVSFIAGRAGIAGRGAVKHTPRLRLRPHLGDFDGGRGRVHLVRLEGRHLHLDLIAIGLLALAAELRLRHVQAEGSPQLKGRPNHVLITQMEHMQDTHHNDPEPLAPKRFRSREERHEERNARWRSRAAHKDLELFLYARWGHISVFILQSSYGLTRSAGRAPDPALHGEAARVAPASALRATPSIALDTTVFVYGKAEAG